MSRFTEHFDLHSNSNISLELLLDPPKSPTNTLSSLTSHSSSSTTEVGIMMDNQQQQQQQQNEQEITNKKLSKMKRFITGTIRRSNTSNSRPSLVIH
ncbi:hypothetical protein INT45_011235 [Circinella minor]|uniref:Uncharacterized protein n=1 Tax=Circinella minor TaxID=1195481 RepID=A0A8H7RHK0_9FUNG|nr:hypothetical protein INT45_011235 [Circinella minor]